MIQNLSTAFDHEVSFFRWFVTNVTSKPNVTKSLLLMWQKNTSNAWNVVFLLCYKTIFWLIWNLYMEKMSNVQNANLRRIPVSNWFTTKWLNMEIAANVPMETKVRRTSGLCLNLWIGLTCWVLTIFLMSFAIVSVPV